jgi:putative PEP-CTERM system histidine kinase
MTVDANHIAAIGYGLAAGLFFLLTALLLSRWRNRSQSQVLALATFATTVWAGILAARSADIMPAAYLATVSEWLRDVFWIIALTMVLRGLDEGKRTEKVAIRYAALLPIVAVVLFALYRSRSIEPLNDVLLVVGGLLLSAVVLVLAEQIYRNAPADTRSGLKYFCLAVVGMFIYDIGMLAWSFVERGIPSDAWAARGYINALFVVPLTYAVKRTFRLSLEALLPRQILFYSFALAGIGAFLTILIAGDYFIRTYGGTWADVGRIVFLVGALAVGATLMLSASVRARTRVFLLKSLFRYKYDYRREWLRFIGTLSESGPEHVPTTAIRAVAQIVNSPGGIAWARLQDEESYLPVGSWRCAMPILSSVKQDSSLIRFLKDRQWIIDLNEMREHPGRYEGLQLDPPFNQQGDWWLIVPMILGSRLFGFIVLLKPRIVPSLNFEDHDLLKTVGRHVATHIDQAESDRRLAESSQFGTYNRLTAFLMHDLNNLIAQQSLVVKNAERFRGNPDFVDDAIDTITHSVARMRRLMGQLTSGSKEPTKKPTDIKRVIDSVIVRTKNRLPEPRLDNCDPGMIVQADPERLSMILEHLIRNAQEATNEEGSIIISADKADGVAMISIADTGCGMTQEFIRDRLFRPFDSTKGSQSMGIGAHQARDYARALGGQLDVTSTPGSGTTFSLRLPMSG